MVRLTQNQVPFYLRQEQYQRGRELHGPGSHDQRQLKQTSPRKESKLHAQKPAWSQAREKEGLLLILYFLNVPIHYPILPQDELVSMKP